MKYQLYPLGHPVVYIGEECPPIEEIHGLVHCKMLPPDNLLYPVLPITINGKLLFPLCKTCAATRSAARCMHTDEERSISSTGVSYECRAAIKFGYRVLEVYEAWCYTETAKFDGQNEGLFSNYINAMLRKKQEASGFIFKLFFLHFSYKNCFRFSKLGH